MRECQLVATGRMELGLVTLPGTRGQGILTESKASHFLNIVLIERSDGMTQERGRGKPSSQKYCEHVRRCPAVRKWGCSPSPRVTLPQGQSTRGDTSNFVLDTPGRHHRNQGLGAKTTCDKACG